MGTKRDRRKLYCDIKQKGKYLCSNPATFAVLPKGDPAETHVLCCGKHLAQAMNTSQATGFTVVKVAK